MRAAAAQAGIQLSWGSVVPGLNKRPRYSARGRVGDVTWKRRQSAPRGAPESIALRGRARLALRRLQIRKCAAVSTIPVTNASVQEYSKAWRTNLVTVRSPFTTQGPPSSAARLTPLLKLGGKVAAGCPNLSSGTPVGRGLHGLQGCPLSNAQCQQLDNAQSDKEDRESYGIIIEPMPIASMHDVCVHSPPGNAQVFLWFQTEWDRMSLCERPERMVWPAHDMTYPRSCTTSRLRCSSVRLNSRTAAASAASRLGACTSPSTCAFLRISDARQEREAAARGLLSRDNWRRQAPSWKTPPALSPWGTHTPRRGARTS
jgi:hypothetical protein